MKMSSEYIDIKLESEKQFSPKLKSEGRTKLETWLNKNIKVVMTDGRILIGQFLCTDRDANIILGGCNEFMPPDDDGSVEEPRVLGLAMVPGRHIVSLCIDDIAQASINSSYVT